MGVILAMLFIGILAYGGCFFVVQLMVRWFVGDAAVVQNAGSLAIAAAIIVAALIWATVEDHYRVK